MKKKLLIFSGSRADYGLLKPIILKSKKYFNTLLCCGPQHFSSKFSNTFKEITKDKIKINSKIISEIKKTDIEEIIKIISLSLTKINKELNKLKPDLVLLLGDRYEVFTMATCCYLKNIKLAHIHGGEVTEGSFDEGLRHSITKMSNIHFVSHQRHKKNVVQLGENPNTVFNVGAIGAENSIFYKKNKKNKREYNSYIVITLHPETKNLKQDIITLKNIFRLVIANKKYFFFFTNSNSDTGGLKINKLINNFCRINSNQVKNLKSLGHNNFIKKIANAKLIMGNSSSSIVEGSTLQIPAINIGDRQKGRLMSNNIINTKNDYRSLSNAFKKALKIDNVKIKKIFYKKNTTNNIVKILKSYLDKNNKVSKKFYEIK